MREGIRQLIEHSLEIRSLGDTVELFALVRPPITAEYVDSIRRNMQKAGRHTYGYKPRLAKVGDPAARSVRIERRTNEINCQRLAAATNDLFAREARKRGASVEAVRLLLTYGPQELARMMAKAA